MEILAKISPITDEEYDRLEGGLIDQLVDLKYSEANIARIQELKKRGLSARVARKLGRSMEIYGPTLTDSQVLARMSDEEILSIKGVGPKGLESIRSIKP